MTVKFCFPSGDWRKCLEEAGEGVLYEIFIEDTFFGTNEYFRKQTYSIVLAKIT